MQELAASPFRRGRFLLSLVAAGRKNYLSHMTRAINALFLSLLLAFTSLSFASARGQNPDLGTEIVICTGVGMTTITLGADGEPIETTHICPDGTSIFSASFTLPVIEQPQTRLVARVTMDAVTPLITLEELSPSARGPPALV